MIFLSTALPGAYLIHPQPHGDERGSFVRTWCQQEFAAHGLTDLPVQTSVSYNHRRGTLRGMHWQAAPHAESKMVRCTRGAIYDVIIDLRPDSPTFMGWIGLELSWLNRAQLYVPKGCAHGFQTLEDNTEVSYQISELYAPEAGRGVRYDDPAFSINWPLPVRAISSQDRMWPDFLRPTAQSTSDRCGPGSDAACVQESSLRPIPTVVAPNM